MPTRAHNEDALGLVKHSMLYKEFLAERDEILRHKWIESEKAGCDIGFERALFDWIVKYRSAWLDERRRLLLAHADKMRPYACTGYDQEGRASLRVDGLLVENRNQAEESSSDHCPLERGKEGIPWKDQEMMKVAV